MDKQGSALPDSRILPTKYAVAGEIEYLTKDKQVQKKIIIKGDTGAGVSKGTHIAMDYEGRLQDKIYEVFDSSQYPKPFEMKYKEDQVIEGWEIGLKNMQVGEKAMLTIGP